MKNAVFGIVMLLGLSAVAFSLDESWLSVGASFGNYFEKGSDLGDFYVGSPGMSLNAYGFSNRKNIGIFLNYGLLFPVAETLENNYKPGPVLWNAVIGPGFRYAISETLKLHFGIGLDLAAFAFRDKESDDVKSVNARAVLGIGADIGLKHDITDVLYLDFGTTLSYDFVGDETIESTVDNWTNTKRESDGFINGYSLLGIRPYIALGFNYYQERGTWGKPK